MDYMKNNIIHYNTFIWDISASQAFSNLTYVDINLLCY